MRCTHCAQCGKAESELGPGAAVALQLCGQCKQVAYCSRPCQKKHWKGGHKQLCTEAGECVFCLTTDEGPYPSLGIVPIQHGCGCRGSGGLRHTGCVVHNANSTDRDMASVLQHELTPETNPWRNPWHFCTTCKMEFTGDTALVLSKTISERVHAKFNREHGRVPWAAVEKNYLICTVALEHHFKLLLDRSMIKEARRTMAQQDRVTVVRYGEDCPATVAIRVANRLMMARHDVDPAALKSHEQFARATLASHSELSATEEHDGCVVAEIIVCSWMLLAQALQKQAHFPEAKEAHGEARRAVKKEAAVLAKVGAARPRHQRREVEIMEAELDMHRLSGNLAEEEATLRMLIKTSDDDALKYTQHLGVCLKRSGRRSSAEALLAPGLENRQARELGPHNPYVALAAHEKEFEAHKVLMSAAIKAYNEAGGKGRSGRAPEFDVVMQAQRVSHQRLVQTLGPDHDHAAAAQYMLGISLSFAHDDLEAAQVCGEVASIYERTHGRHHANHVRAAVAQAGALVAHHDALALDDTVDAGGTPKDAEASATSINKKHLSDALKIVNQIHDTEKSMGKAMRGIAQNNLTQEFGQAECVMLKCWVKLRRLDYRALYSTACVQEKSALGVSKAADLQPELRELQHSLQLTLPIATNITARHKEGTFKWSNEGLHMPYSVTKSEVNQIMEWVVGVVPLRVDEATGTGSIVNRQPVMISEFTQEFRDAHGPLFGAWEEWDAAARDLRALACGQHGILHGLWNDVVVYVEVHATLHAFPASVVEQVEAPIDDKNPAESASAGGSRPIGGADAASTAADGQGSAVPELPRGGDENAQGSPAKKGQKKKKKKNRK